MEIVTRTKRESLHKKYFDRLEETVVEGLKIAYKIRRGKLFTVPYGDKIK
jgi:hypothetical protein